MDVLVSGAGVAGPVLAYWLRRGGVNPTVVERAPAMRRAGGHAVDLWGPAVDVVERMGLLPEIDAARTGNDVSSLVRPGKPSIDIDVAALGARFSERSVEIPRDELTHLLYEASRHDAEYLFGDTVTALDEDADGVRVTFRHARPRRFDLVIGADGLHSTVRRLAFGPESRFRRHLGAYIAVYTIPNVLELDGRILTYSAVDSTVVVYPAGNRDEARAVFLFRQATEFDDDRHDVAAQKRRLREAYAGGGWEVPRLLEHLDTTDAFYFDSISQIRMGTFSHGRVALVGDAGYATGAGVGGGTSVAVAGAYVLAREAVAAGGDHRAGFHRYEDAIRDTVVAGRRVGPALLATLIPASRVAIWRGQQLAKLLPLLPRWLTRRLPLLPRDAVHGLRAIASLPVDEHHHGGPHGRPATSAASPAADAVTHTVELSAGTIEYEDTGGDGPVLVFLHGLLMDGSLWRHVVADLRPQYRCVLPTLPLGGHRTPMRPDADLSLAAMADLIGEFLEGVDLHEVTLVQNDWGGAQILIARDGAERVARLILTSCEAFDNYPPSIARPIVPLAKVPGGLRVLMQLLRLRAVRRAPGGWGWMSKGPVPDEVMTSWFRPATSDPAIRRDLAKYVTSVPSRPVLLEWARHGASFDRPVLVAWAAEDRTMPLEHGRRLAALFPDAELVEIPDSYTLIPEDQPHELTRHLRAFLNRTDDPPAPAPGRAGRGKQQ